ncbi:MAG: hypothetical protein OEY40_05710 [Candidatus Bathyarchaeota archaeon]|nr:hypothetical protein [Candidatus Bathyarchaeota archaeon]
MIKTKAKATTAILLTAFLSSMLTTAFVMPVMAENPVISEVERSAGEYWFHLVTGQYPNGVWARDWIGEPKYYEEEGYLGLTYRNLSPEMQQIRLTTSPGANHAFWHWPEKTAYEVWLEGGTGTTWIIWPVPPDEWLLMTDLWFIGWGAGEQIHVTLEYTYCMWWPVPPEEWTLVYDDYMTIMPLGP